MKTHKLQGTKRDAKTVKVKVLRREGRIPATVYGRKIKSESLSVASSDFRSVYADAGETGLVELTLDNSMRPVLIHEVQKDPVSDVIIHIEFHQVDLKEKVKAAVPISLIGEAPAVNQKLGVILSLLSEVEVEALPAHLPEKLELDVSTLEAVDQELKVSDLKAPSGVTLITDGSVVVTKVGALVSKEAQEQAAAEAAAKAAAAAVPEEAAKTEEAPETESKAAEEKKPEEK